jgi:hypothetical protein
MWGDPFRVAFFFAGEDGMLRVDSPRRAGAPGIGSKTLIGLAAVGALMFVVIAALPYRAMLGSQETARQVLQPFQFSYWPRRGWLLAHISGGLIALLTGPVQLWLGLHNVKMHVHRRLGLIYVASITIGSIGAIGLAFKTDGDVVFGAGLFFLAMAWITTTSLAYLAIRKDLTDQHKEWTIRSYVVTFAFVIFRASETMLARRGVPERAAADLMTWACWAVPLLATEAVIQGRKIVQVRS